MPGYPSAGRIHSSMKSCSGEGFLDRATSGSAEFKIDVENTRESVARGTYTPEYGISIMRREGGLSPMQEKQLTVCLGRIVAGKCPSYPLINVAEFSFIPE